MITVCLWDILYFGGRYMSVCQHHYERKESINGRQWHFEDRPDMIQGSIGANVGCTGSSFGSNFVYRHVTPNLGSFYVFSPRPPPPSLTLLFTSKHMYLTSDIWDKEIIGLMKEWIKFLWPWAKVSAMALIKQIACLYNKVRMTHLFITFLGSNHPHHELYPQEHISMMFFSQLTYLIYGNVFEMPITVLRSKGFRKDQH